MQKYRRKQIEISFHTSRFRFFWHYILVLLFFIAGFVFYRLGYSIFYAGLSLLAAFLGLLLLELRIKMERLVIREDDLRIDAGFLSKNTTRVRYHNITDFYIRQTFLQRLLGYGDIEIGVPSGSVQQTQYFSGKGDVKVEPAAQSRGIRLRKFQNVKKIESLILSKMHEKPYHSR